MRQLRLAAVAVSLWVGTCALSPVPSRSLPAASPSTASSSFATKPAAPNAPEKTGAEYARYLSAYWKRQADYYDAEREYNRAFWQQRARQAQLNTDAFARQGQQDPIILAVVVFVVISGVCLSIAQVAKGFIVPGKIATLAASSAAGADATATSAAGATTDATDSARTEQINTFKASMRGIEFSSASIGLMMLSVSLAFFFLYLKFVYTITQVGS
jgi:hypothetical protein